MGAERDLLLYSALISILVALGGFTILAGGAALIFWLVMVYILRRTAKEDPQLSKVFLTHFYQQDFYGAHSTPWQLKGAGLK